MGEEKGEDAIRAQRTLWFELLMEGKKLDSLHAYLADRGYPMPGECVVLSLKEWAREGRTFEDVDELDAALRNEWSAQAGKAKTTWGHDR